MPRNGRPHCWLFVRAQDGSDQAWLCSADPQLGGLEQQEDAGNFLFTFFNFHDIHLPSQGCYLRQMLLNERQEQLLLLLDGSCAQLHSSLLPRLYSSAQLKLWQIVRRILELQLLRGQPPEYYKEVEVGKCRINGIDIIIGDGNH
jgi:hypothetical protein